jgi:hypothetical protein
MGVKSHLFAVNTSAFGQIATEGFTLKIREAWSTQIIAIDILRFIDTEGNINRVIGIHFKVFVGLVYGVLHTSTKVSILSEIMYI